LLYKQRMRRLAVLVIVLVAACADSGDDSIPCGGGQGPLDVTFSHIDLVSAAAETFAPAASSYRPCLQIASYLQII